MIIFDDLNFQTRSDMPNTLWDDNAKWVVDDNSELADKILGCDKFEAVEDNDGNLVDVVPIGKEVE